MQHRHSDREMYFWEQSVTSEKYFIPFIEKFKNITVDTEMLEIGCGDGGNLLPFVKRNCKVTAVDRATSRIEKAREFFTGHGYKVHLVQADIFDVTDIGLFDIILMNDVIEHIHDKALLLEILKKLLKPGGIIFLGFPAWQMPFGGHQQICRNPIISRMPFIHLFPKSIYKLMLITFNERDSIVQELLSIREARITIEMYRRLVNRQNFQVLYERFYLINPHYEIKFKLRPVILPRFLGGIPIIRNFFITSCFSVLKSSNN